LEAAAALRKVDGAEPLERIALCAADPLNLAGTLTPDGKVPRLRANRVLFENGVPVAVYRARETRHLEPASGGIEWERQTALVRRARSGPSAPEIESR